MAGLPTSRTAPRRADHPSSARPPGGLDEIAGRRVTGCAAPSVSRLAAPRAGLIGMNRCEAGPHQRNEEEFAVLRGLVILLVPAAAIGLTPFSSITPPPPL